MGHTSNICNTQHNFSNSPNNNMIHRSNTLASPPAGHQHRRRQGISIAAGRASGIAAIALGSTVGWCVGSGDGRFPKPLVFF